MVFLPSMRSNSRTRFLSDRNSAAPTTWSSACTAAFPPSLMSFLRRNSRLGEMPCLRATYETFMPGCSDSWTSSSFSTTASPLALGLDIGLDLSPIAARVSGPNRGYSNRMVHSLATYHTFLRNSYRYRCQPIPCILCSLQTSPCLLTYLSRITFRFPGRLPNAVLGVGPKGSLQIPRLSLSPDALPFPDRRCFFLGVRPWPGSS